MASYKIDQKMLLKARKELQLRYPVKISIRHLKPDDLGTTYGFYWGKREGYHRITLTSWMGPRAASMVLWHELMHAKQCERAGGNRNFNRRYDKQLKRAKSRTGRKRLSLQALNSIPYEQQAIRAQRRHRRLPLAYRA